MITLRTAFIPVPFGLSALADIPQVRAVPYGDGVLPVTEAAEMDDGLVHRPRRRAV
jgi:hypothetical protein